MVRPESGVGFMTFFGPMLTCTDECPVLQMADIESAATTLSSRQIEGLGQSEKSQPPSDGAREGHVLMINASSRVHS